jgi:hypothetical protein
VGIGFALDIYADTIMQTRLPQSLLGRAASIMMVVAFGPMPLGLILAGVLVNAVGVRVTDAVSGGAMLLILVLIARPVMAGARNSASEAARDADTTGVTA